MLFILLLPKGEVYMIQNEVYMIQNEVYNYAKLSISYWAIWLVIQYNRGANAFMSVLWTWVLDLDSIKGV